MVHCLNCVAHRDLGVGLRCAPVTGGLCELALSLGQNFKTKTHTVGWRQPLTAGCSAFMTALPCAGGPTLDPSKACKTFQTAPGQHIVVGSLANPGGEVIMNGNSRWWKTASIQACWDLCMRTKGCRGATFGTSSVTFGQCYMKPQLPLASSFGPNAAYSSIFPRALPYPMQAVHGFFVGCCMQCLNISPFISSGIGHVFS